MQCKSNIFYSGEKSVTAMNFEEDLMPRQLPVDDWDTIEDFDPSVPPRTPQEYLKRVQIEASRCPEVVVAKIDPRKLKRNPTVNVSLSGCQPAPAGFSPSLRWQQQQVANFSILRQSIAKHRDHWKSQPLDSNVMLPAPDDEEGWKKFCLGEKLYCDSSVPPNTNEIDSPGIDYVQVGFPPLLSIVSRMSQPTVFNTLEYLINWFGDKKLYPELGRWLYALLACIEKPLLPEAHSLIRQLARRCSAVRAKLENPEDAELSAVNLLICLVARYFEQSDLADND
ncbi:gem-associated protein 2 isoform X1 [Hemiscyllium ocellatum]|uniref:gem-associated protein 2 isoform X1 n=2 Tax=Hemiscyllium ocellatum TaxID=170820 RepID=UPI002966E443|nr:gem-associated protein 2 isoform X1 [Hemiscyllium ocellatum]